MASICGAVASPGGPATGLSESVTMAWPATLWLATELSSQAAEAPILAARLHELGRIIGQLLVIGIAETAGDIGDHGGVERERPVPDRAPFLLDRARKLLGAELMHENLDAGLVDVVAPAVLIVGAHDRFDVAQQIALRQERLDGLADEWRASEPAADHHLETGFAGAVAVEPQADVVDLDGGAVVRRRRDRDLELARQE